MAEAYGFGSLIYIYIYTAFLFLFLKFLFFSFLLSVTYWIKVWLFYLLIYIRICIDRLYIDGILIKPLFLYLKIAINTINLFPMVLTLWWLREETKIYIWNELPFIVVVKYKHSSISGRSPIGEIKKFISFCS